MRGPAFLPAFSLAAGMAAAVAGAPVPLAPPQVKTALLSDLKQAFQADQGKVRLLLVFSPT